MGSAQIDLILKKTFNTSRQLSESFKNYFLYQFLAKPLTKIKTEESFNEVYNCLRNENLYFLIASCNLFEEISRKSIENNNVLKDLNISITRLASGIPMGADMEYVDAITLEKAFDNRKKIS